MRIFYAFLIAASLTSCTKTTVPSPVRIPENRQDKKDDRPTIGEERGGPTIQYKYNRTEEIIAGTDRKLTVGNTYAVEANTLSFSIWFYGLGKTLTDLSPEDNVTIYFLNRSGEIVYNEAVKISDMESKQSVEGRGLFQRISNEVPLTYDELLSIERVTVSPKFSQQILKKIRVD